MQYLADLLAEIKMQNLYYKQQGFTLLETLVAISIFSLMSLGAYKMLTTVIDSNEATETRSDRLKEIQNAFSILSNDISQIINRDIRDKFGDEKAAFIANDDGNLEFTRQGWVNHFKYKRSELQRVEYRFEDGKLFRNFWPIIDHGKFPKYLTQKIISDSKGLDFRFLDEDNKWHARWDFLSGADDISNLPIAVEILLDDEIFGEIRKVIAVAAK